MRMIDRGEILNLFFERNGSIVCAANYQMSLSALPQQKWFKREVGDENDTV